MRQIIIDPDEHDDLVGKVIKFVHETQKSSASIVQRKFNIGYARSARMMDELETLGVVGPFRGAKPRKVLIGVGDEIKIKKIKKKTGDTDLPKSLVEKYKEKHDDYVRKNATLLEQFLNSFDIIVRVAEINNRPNDIEFALEIALGTRISDILSLENDIAMALAVPPEFLIIEAPIPGRSLIAVRVPYPNYESWESPKYLPPKEEKKEEFPDVKRDNFDNLLMKSRGYLSFIFYLIAKLFNIVANFIYPERKSS